MGKQPSQHPQFMWARRDFGHYVAIVDSLDYAVVRLSRHRWELTVTADGRRVMSTTGDSFRHLRCYARLTHRHTLTHMEVIPMAAVITDAMLAALALHQGTLTLAHTDTGDGYYAHLRAHPRGADEPVDLSVFHTDAAQALCTLGVQVIEASAPGGSLSLDHATA